MTMIFHRLFPDRLDHGPGARRVACRDQRPGRKGDRLDPDIAADSVEVFETAKGGRNALIVTGRITPTDIRQNLNPRRIVLIGHSVDSSRNCLDFDTG
jgi:hypothetical protein